MINFDKLSSEIFDMASTFSFPEEATVQLKADLKKISDNAECYADFCRWVEDYDKTVEIDYPAALRCMKDISAKTGVHEYALNMLHYLSLCPKLRERYAERGLSDKMFVDTMRDLKFKLIESHIVHGIWGTFVPTWYARFFSAFDRFFFVRLQLEPVEVKYDCVVDGLEIKKGAKALNVHIPRTETPLLHDEVVESYKAAAEFFKDYFDGDPVIMVCNSWLLFPKHDEILKPGSNMLRFAHDFTIVEEGVYNDGAGFWRTFDRVYNGNPDELPTDTTLRRAYVDMLKRGEHLGYGYGVIVFDKMMEKLNTGAL